jgi:hypothetical protein
VNLRELAASDAQSFLEDVDAGFAWEVSLEAPERAPVALRGYSNDIHQTIDPETGVAVAGRRASVAFSTKTLAAAQLPYPRGEADSGRKPWVVVFNDIDGVPHTFKVIEAFPDRALGIVTCHLEAYYR